MPRGISLNEASVGERGVVHNRELLVVDGKAAFITQRTASGLALVDIELESIGLRLRAPGMPELGLKFDDRKAPPERAVPHLP